MHIRLFITIVIISSSYYLKAQNLYLYPYKSGVIKYKFKGATQGTQTIYFDNYGRKISEIKNSISETAGNMEKESRLNIYRNDSLFKINMNNGTVSVFNSSQHIFKTKLISKEIIEVLGYNKLSNEFVAGKNCIKYSGENGSIWVWNNIVLKSEMQIMDILITYEATSVKMDINIEKSIFEIPSKFTIINQ